VSRGFSLRQLFWITGTISFFLSPLIDNLTTALVMSAVAMAVGKGNPRFVLLASINIVVAANAGGAFSPFGDITTLMVWQAGVLEFATFFALFIPSVVNYLIPAIVMQFAVPKAVPQVSSEQVTLKRGGKTIMVLFLITIAIAVSFHNFLHLPPFLGMMTGLALLKIYGYYLGKTHRPTAIEDPSYGEVGDVNAFDSFEQVARADLWLPRGTCRLSAQFFPPRGCVGQHLFRSLHESRRIMERGHPVRRAGLLAFSGCGADRRAPALVQGFHRYAWHCRAPEARYGSKREPGWD
jgi:hypothetical protein